MDLIRLLFFFLPLPIIILKFCTRLQNQMFALKSLFWVLPLFVAVNGQSKVNVGVYMESCCPDTQRFIVDQLRPAWEMPGFNDIANVILSPYGKENYTFYDNEYYFTCQHGSEECLGQRIESCVIALYPDPLIYIPYIINLETQFNDIKCQNSTHCCNPTPYAKETAYQTILDWNLIENCYENTINGNNAVLNQANITYALKPSLTYIPWITINGVRQV